MINCIIFFVLGVILGVFIGIIIWENSPDGDIIVNDDELYLNVNRKSMDKIINNKRVVIFKVKRK